MIAVRLSDYYRSFATRSRAREILDGQPAQGPFLVDVSGVFISPSFMAELLLGLVKRGPVQVVADEQTWFNLDMVRTLKRQLNIAIEVGAAPLATA